MGNGFYNNVTKNTLKYGKISQIFVGILQIGDNMSNFEGLDPLGAPFWPSMDERTPIFDNTCWDLWFWPVLPMRISFRLSSLNRDMIDYRAYMYYSALYRPDLGKYFINPS